MYRIIKSIMTARSNIIIYLKKLINQKNNSYIRIFLYFKKITFFQKLQKMIHGISDKF